MKTPSLLRSIFSRRPAAPIAKAPAYSRPEPLEDRIVLSTFLVTTLANGGPGSLRNALAKTNTSPGPDIVQFAPGLAGTIALSGSELLITSPVTIAGPGPGLIKISGQDALRVFEIAPAKTVSISGLTITHGLAPGGGNGGGIENFGNLKLTNVVLDSNKGILGGGGIENKAGATLTLIASKIINSTSNGFGGGILNNTGATATLVRTLVSHNTMGLSGEGAGVFNSGTMSIRLSTISDNIGTGGVFSGGGIRNGGDLTILSSTIARNVTTGRGGGIANLGGTLTLTNTTIAENISMGSSGGGGIFSLSSTTIIDNCTITRNIDAADVASSAGGIFIAAGAILHIDNTVVAGNFAGSSRTPDINGAAASSNGNFIGIGDATLKFLIDGISGNKVGTVAAPLDPKLGILANNGGVTFTIAPLPGSPLLNAGVNIALPTGLTTDQRGRPRIHSGTVDIGAVER